MWQSWATWCYPQPYKTKGYYLECNMQKILCLRTAHSWMDPLNPHLAQNNKVTSWSKVKVRQNASYFIIDSHPLPFCKGLTGVSESKAIRLSSDTPFPFLHKTGNPSRSHRQGLLGWDSGQGRWSKSWVNPAPIDLFPYTIISHFITTGH